MNYQMTKYILGAVMFIVSIMLLFPFVMSCFEGDWHVILAFGITLLFAVVFTFYATRQKPKRKSIYAKDGFAIVGLSWVLISIVGALPYFISQEIPNFVDALFESVSGFTTTGSSILKNVEALPRSVLLWRSITHWIGGMGVLVFITAIISFAGGNSMYLMRAEAYSPTAGKLAPKIRKNAFIIYSVYFGVTLLAFILLLFGGIGWFDSLTNAFSVVATGGFSVRNESIAFYDSSYIEWVLIFFMWICSVNFHVIYLFCIGKFSAVFKNAELRTFCAVTGLALVFTVFELQMRMGGSFWDNLRDGAFQLSSFMSTTGFFSTDYSVWPPALMMLFLPIALLGGCTGSTAGGLKMIRLLYLVKSIKREIKKMLHPNAVEVVKVSGKPIDEESLSSVNVFFVTYIFIILASMLLVATDGFDMETTVSAVCISISNTGMGYGLISPGGSFADFSILSKLIFIFDMLIGRLSIFPILFLFMPSIWSRRKNSQKLEI